MPLIFPRPDKFTPLTQADGKTALDAWFDFWGYLDTQIKSGSIASSRIVGTTTNDNAAAGIVGEYMSNSGVVALTTATPANLTSLPLTAGDWDVECIIQFDGAGATATSDVWASLGNVSATMNSTLGQYGRWRGAATTDLFFPISFMTRVSLAAPATYFLTGQAAFVTSTYSGRGLMRARRAR